MPELPEVETTLKGIKPFILGQKITNLIIRQPRLRWDLPQNLTKLLQNQTLQALTRRGKYLLFRFSAGTLILHLGMSGRLCVLKKDSPYGKHDHVDIFFNHLTILRYTDPRRFGAILFTPNNPLVHPLLSKIGPEPLSRTFNSTYLSKRAKRHRLAIKSFIMDSKIIAGLGNIYATEALFIARIHPLKPANDLSKQEHTNLVRAIKTVLKLAIKKGGTTLRDFKQSDGKPGYFRMELQVYGRQGKPCPRCHVSLQQLRITGRSTVYCKQCQPAPQKKVQTKES